MRLCVWSQAGRRDVHSKFSLQLHVLINGNFTLLAAFFSEYKTEYSPIRPPIASLRRRAAGAARR